MNSGRRMFVGWLIVAIFTLSVASVAASQPEFRTLAAFDAGSGTTRMLVADVDVCSGDILTIHAARTARVAYADDLLQGDGQNFSEKIREQADRVMAEFSELAVELGAEKMVGVATQAFRTADNGQRLLDEWKEKYDLQIRLISQDEEARMAYRLVEARLEPPASRLVVWDIGAGSQQLVWRDANDGSWRHLNNKIASVSFRNWALSQLERPAEQKSPNPIDAREAGLLSAGLTSLLTAKELAGLADYVAHGARVIGIGGVHGASLANQLGLGPDGEITREAVQTALNRQLGRTDEEIGGDYADTEVSNLILVGTLMDQYGIDRYRVMSANLTEAVLLHQAEDCSPTRRSTRQTTGRSMRPSVQ